MKGHIIRALVDATANVLYTQTGVRQEVGINNFSPFGRTGFHVIVNLSGSHPGSLKMTMSYRTARKIASACVKVRLEDKKMIGGIITAITTGLISEAILNLRAQGCDCVPSFPVLREGCCENHDTDHSCICFNSVLGTIKVNVELAEKELTGALQNC